MKPCDAICEMKITIGIHIGQRAIAKTITGPSPGIEKRPKPATVVSPSAIAKPTRSKSGMSPTSSTPSTRDWKRVKL